jgi:hypothetical protein
MAYSNQAIKQKKKWIWESSTRFLGNNAKNIFNNWITYNDSIYIEENKAKVNKEPIEI